MTEQLVTVLAAFLTLISSAIHGHDPRIKSWDGTTLRVEWEGVSYTATFPQ